MAIFINGFRISSFIRGHEVPHMMSSFQAELHTKNFAGHLLIERKNMLQNYKIEMKSTSTFLKRLTLSRCSTEF